MLLEGSLTAGISHRRCSCKRVVVSDNSHGATHMQNRFRSSANVVVCRPDTSKLHILTRENHSSITHYQIFTHSLSPFKSLLCARPRPHIGHMPVKQRPPHFPPHLWKIDVSRLALPACHPLLLHMLSATPPHPPHSQRPTPKIRHLPLSSFQEIFFPPVFFPYKPAD